MKFMTKGRAYVPASAGSLRSGRRTASAGSSLAVVLLSTTCLCPTAFAQSTQSAQSNPVDVPTIQIAQAAPQTAQETAQAPAMEQIVVTGTRIQRDGYEAPTPVSVVSPELMQNTASNNLADSIVQLPTLANSNSPQATAANTTSGQSGVYALSIHGLGELRTLTLLNGQRIVGDNLYGVVDVNELPQALISRVDVEKGGASATYGSDALAGVVNYILDTNFNGVKGQVDGNVTTYGDDRQWHISLAGGTGFGDGKGHFEFSAEAAYDQGLLSADRPWDEQGWYYISNPAYTSTNGQPQVLALNHVATSVTSWGGTIASGPLRGTAFGPGGAQYQTVFGSIVADPLMSGGSWAVNQVAPVRGVGVDPEQNRQNIFTRASWDLSDNVNIYAQAQWGHQFQFSQGAPNFFPQSLVISSSNPFIPANLAPTLLAAGTTVTIGTFNQDLDDFHSWDDRRVNRWSLGANGKLDAFDTTWKWDAYIGIGMTTGALHSVGAINRPNFALATNAVRAPNGSIVCADTLVNPADGCVPYDPFGIGVNSQAAINYVQGTYGWVSERLFQHMYSVSATGAPFSTWAGPISIAVDADHRSESMRQISDPVEVANPTVWFQAAGLPYTGSYNVTEGALETVIPLAKDASWAKELDLNGAVRATDYSTFGYTTTWNIGGTYAPIDDLRFRVTHSRNLREPTLIDLYQAGSTSRSSINDPFNANASVNDQQTTSGNPNLKPEVGMDTGLGAVYQPSWLQGFSASFDYFRDTITGAIETASAQQFLNACFAGNAVACTTFTRTGSGATQQINVFVQPENFGKEFLDGFDIDATYRLKLNSLVDSWDGNLMFNFSAEHISNYIVTQGLPGTFPINYAGDNNGSYGSGSGLPSWRLLGVIDYNLDPVNVGFTFHGISGGVDSPVNIVCTSACPTPVPAGYQTVTNNHVAGAFYVDFNFAYTLHVTDTGTTQLFLNVSNIANRGPSITLSGPGGSNYDFYPTSFADYSEGVLGRVFMAGVRFKM